jgi:hypothetical protein
MLAEGLLKLPGLYFDLPAALFGSTIDRRRSCVTVRCRDIEIIFHRTDRAQPIVGSANKVVQTGTGRIGYLVAHSARAASRHLSDVPLARLLAHPLAVCWTVFLGALNLFRDIACPGVSAFALGGYEGLRHPLKIPTPTPGPGSFVD